MIKELSLLFGIVLIVSYLIFAFANWNMAWAAHVNTVMRVTFVCFYVAMCCIAAFAYLEVKDRLE